MLTVFHVVQLVALLAGGFVGAKLGHDLFGAGGGVGGALLGGFVGWMAGRLPFLITFNWACRSFRRQSTDALRVDLASKYYIAHLILAELMRRGEDIRQDLAVVVDHLSSDDCDRRRFGIACLRLGYPDLAQRLHDYEASESTETCRSKVARLAGTLHPEAG